MTHPSPSSTQVLAASSTLFCPASSLKSSILNLSSRSVSSSIGALARMASFSRSRTSCGVLLAAFSSLLLNAASMASLAAFTCAPFFAFATSLMAAAPSLALLRSGNASTNSSRNASLHSEIFVCFASESVNATAMPRHVLNVFFAATIAPCLIDLSTSTSVTSAAAPSRLSHVFASIILSLTI